MSDQRPIQRYTGGNSGSNGGAGGGNPVGAIMTAQGPAIIQVIDMPTGLGPVNTGFSSGPKPRKPGGINVVGAVMRRWWLVLLVFLTVGGGALFAGANLVKPMFSAVSKVSFIDNNPNASGSGLAYSTIHRNLLLINSRPMVLRAAADPRLRQAMPKVFNVDLTDPAQQAAVVSAAQGLIDIPEETLRGTGVLDLIAVAPSPEQACAIANAYADALVWFCTKQVNDTNAKILATVDEEINSGQAALATLIRKKSKLVADNNFEALSASQQATLRQLIAVREKFNKAKIDLGTAQAAYDRLIQNATESANLQLQRKDMIKAEQDHDLIVQNLLQQYGAALGKLNELRTQGKTEVHPDVIHAKESIDQYNTAIDKRMKEIEALVNARFDERVKLQGQKSLEELKEAIATSNEELKIAKEEEARLNIDAGKLAVVREEIDYITSLINDQMSKNRDNAVLRSDTLRQMLKTPTAEFKVEQPAVATLKEDKRIKVQAGGLVGGLFLGLLLALLVDKFDKRLRDPRDIEPLFGTPLLGCIPRIQELKKIKGEQARNLIAEEFRVIRTQVLFGNPNLPHKLIAITSPTPGDGKTSLAVNLAISIAKAGRRVLLIDGDLRKPDVHRVFNLSDNPGFAELIQNSHEPGAVIKKSEIEGLEILPAGTPLTRPSELLSRPEVARLLVALGDLYDHIVLDTAPLLPVSDTHVLAGMVDAVIVSFNAEVDRDTVSVTQEILRRSRANVIGCVMNQVKYRQSGSYQRGKTAYDSYYSSTRGAPKSDGKGDKSDKLTTIGKS